MGSPPPAPSSGAATTVVTQTRVRPEQAEAFARWQQQVNDVVARFPDFVDQQVIPPSPPAQVDWVILQKFVNAQAALAWLQSQERLRLVEVAQPMLVGHDDIHLMEDDSAGAPTAPVSAVISTRIKPGQEAAYQAWQQRIATVQAQFPGFQGYKATPPIPGVQDDWVTILRYDSEAHLNAWMTSPERRRLLDEAAAFTAETHARTVRTGFDQWFRVADGGGAPPPAWKQNMLVLLALYPVVFLFGHWVQTPLLMDRARLPFWLALFIGNVAGVLILSWVVPWISLRFRWWLRPSGPEPGRVNLTGTALVVALYALYLLLFSRFP